MTGADRTRRWRAANLDQARASTRQSVGRWRSAHREVVRLAGTERRDRLRLAVFDHYGRVCACCGVTENLTIDHADGQGAAHRAQLFRGSRQAGWHFYAWLVKQGFPPGYATMCRPCNSSKQDGDRCQIDHGEASRAR